MVLQKMPLCGLFFLFVLLLAPPSAAQTGQTCGGFAGLRCPEGQACRFPAGQCNVADLAGNCVPVPATCPQQGPPVCSCEGETFANECELLMAGARPLRQGACGHGDGRSAVCRSNAECQANEFCELKAGTCGERGSGRCIVRPQVCTDIFQPVCGCDNRTYSNNCVRRAAGVSLLAPGECPAAPSTR